MTLEQWITLSGTTKADVAKKIGASRGSVTRWCKGERKPEPRFAYALLHLSLYQIQLSHWGYPVGETIGVQVLWGWLFQNGLTITQGAKKMGFAPMTMRGWMTSGTVPSEKNLKKLSKFLECDFVQADFMRGENDEVSSHKGDGRASGEGQAAIR